MKFRVYPSDVRPRLGETKINRLLEEQPKLFKNFEETLKMSIDV